MVICIVFLISYYSAMIVFVQMFWCTCVCIVGRYIPTSEIGRRKRMHMLCFSIYCKKLPKLYLFIFPLAVHKSSSCCTSLWKVGADSLILTTQKCLMGSHCGFTLNYSSDYMSLYAISYVYWQYGYFFCQVPIVHICSFK